MFETALLLVLVIAVIVTVASAVFTSLVAYRTMSRTDTYFRDARELAVMLQNYVDFIESEDEGDGHGDLEREEDEPPDDGGHPWKDGESGRLAADIKDLPEPDEDTYKET